MSYQKNPLKNSLVTPQLSQIQQMKTKISIQKQNQTPHHIGHIFRLRLLGQNSMVDFTSVEVVQVEHELCGLIVERERLVVVVTDRLGRRRACGRVLGENCWEIDGNYTQN